MRPVGPTASGNYLRVRGEYRFAYVRYEWFVELPPRARRILIDNQLRLVHIGTTSACAENTPRGWKIALGAGNYLRVRGEYMATPP